MFSLLHFLASHPRNADTLKRALHGDADARRLFSFLGVTPTHLEAIDEGAIARRSAAVSVPRTVDVTAPASCADRLAEAEKTIKALEARLAQTAPTPEQTPPEEVIVLGPWCELHPCWDMWHRRIVGSGVNNDGLRVTRGGWGGGADPNRWDKCGTEIGEKGKVAADDWAREHGYILLDAEPSSVVGALGPWDATERGFIENEWSGGYIRIGADGWCIVDAKGGRSAAHGPQGGEEGKRYALAAAHALGLTGGGE